MVRFLIDIEQPQGSFREKAIFSLPIRLPPSPRLRLSSAGPRTLAPRFHAARVEFIPNLRAGKPRFPSSRRTFPWILRRAPRWIRWTSWASPRRTSPSPNVSSPALDHLVDVGFCRLFYTYDDYEAVRSRVV